MDVGQIVSIVITTLLIILYSGVELYKWFARAKYSNDSWKTQCDLIASLLEKGVEIPRDLIIKVLRHKLTDKDFSEAILNLKK